MANKYTAAEARQIEVWKEALPMDTLEQLRRQLAKQANQRMVRLEQNVSPVTGESYTFGAYDKVQEYLDRQGRRRFSEKLSQDMDVYQLKREIGELQGFLNSQSSTVGGMHAIERSRLSAFQEKGITAASNREFYDFLNSESFIRLTEKAGFNSEDVVELYQRYYDAGIKPEEIQKAFDEYRSKSGRKSYKSMVKSMNASLIQKKGRRKRK